MTALEIEAGTDETRNAAQPAGRERGPKATPIMEAMTLPISKPRTETELKALIGNAKLKLTKERQ
jgi:hypothetical protein